MTNVNTVKLFRTDLGESAASLVQRLDDWLVATGDIDLIAASSHRRVLRSRTCDLRVSLLYGSGPAGAPTYSGLTVRAAIITADRALLSIESQVALFFSTSPRNSVDLTLIQRVPLFLLDVSEISASNGAGASYLALYYDFLDRRNYGAGRGVFFAAPRSSIAAGADGLCDIYDAFGELCLTDAPAQVRNVASADTWTAGERNYVVMCPLTNRWIGSAPCQYAAPLGTPLRAYRAGPFPRMDGQSAADQAAMTDAYRALPFTPVP